jgi:tetratricopeptide (TPR) repeat protein
MKLKLLGIVLFSLFFSFSALAQMDKANQKNLKKASKLIKKEKYEESAGLIKTVLQDYPLNDKLWKYYQDVLYKNYEKNYKPELSFKIDSEDDSLAFLLQKAVQYVLDKPKWDYLNAVNDATMYTPYNAESSIVMRSYYVDKKYYSDKEVNAKSKAYFEKAEGEFGAKNYEKAIGYYEKAIEEDSTNYKAFLYLGDSYYAMEYYGKAADYFRKAIKMNPMLLEPVKYLADALVKKEEYTQALEVLKQSFLVYPEEGMYIKLYDVLEEIGEQKLDRHWILRRAKIATLASESRRENFFEDITYFSHYEDAGKDAIAKYDSAGLLKEGESALMEKYLEVLCFKEMLKNTNAEDTPELDYARKMDDKGLLAPYLFVNLFNVDLYPQFRHFADNNKAVLEQYINDYLVVQKTGEED